MNYLKKRSIKFYTCTPLTLNTSDKVNQLETMIEADPTETFMERLMDNKEVLEAVLEMPTHMNKELPRIRREENFRFLWETTDMDRTEVLNLVNGRELDFIREYRDEGVPEWMLRCEAQDIFLKIMYDRFEEEGLL